MDKAELDAIKARIDVYARILREHGVRNFDPREMGSPIELTPEEVERYKRRLDVEEHDFVMRELRPLMTLRARKLLAESRGGVEDDQQVKQSGARVNSPAPIARRHRGGGGSQT